MSACAIRRTGRGQAVVFLGGCPTPWDVLSPLASAVAGTGEAIELALPGYGASPPLAGRYTLPAAHAAVETTLLEAGVRACTLVGFSGGAYRALALACRGNVRVDGVLSLSGYAGLNADEAGGLAHFAAAARAGHDLRHVAAPRFLSAAFAAAHPDAVRSVEDWLAAAPAEIIAAELEAFAEAEDLTPALARLGIPVVARAGGADAAVPPARSEAIVAACSTARLEIVPGAGHALVLEDLDGTVSSLLRLLRAAQG